MAATSLVKLIGNSNIAEIMDSASSIPLGMTEFQVKHFVLNEKEYPTDFSKFTQAKLQLYIGLQMLMDFYFQYQEAEANIELANAEIQEIKQNPSQITSAAKIRLKEIDIDKNKFKIESLKHTAKEKVKELNTFYSIYKNLKKFEEINEEDAKKLEEKTWKIKSAYNSELTNRFGLTPKGFLKLPHEEKHNSNNIQK